MIQSEELSTCSFQLLASYNVTTTLEVVSKSNSSLYAELDELCYCTKHCKKSKFPPSKGDYNFQIICRIINFIMLLCREFNNAHLDTSFASIDQKTMKLHPIEGTYPGI